MTVGTKWRAQWREPWDSVRQNLRTDAMGLDSGSIIPHAGRNEMFRTNTPDDRSLNLPRTKYNLVPTIVNARILIAPEASPRRWKSQAQGASRVLHFEDSGKSAAGLEPDFTSNVNSVIWLYLLGTISTPASF